MWEVAQAAVWGQVSGLASTYQNKFQEAGTYIVDLDQDSDQDSDQDLDQDLDQDSDQDLDQDSE